MSSEMHIVRVGAEPPEDWSASLYLCGPTPTDPGSPSWRPDAVEELRRTWRGPGRLTVFVPEPAEGGAYPGYREQVAWEEEMMRRSDLVLFYVPRRMPGLPGLVSNVKWGVWHDSGRVVLGAPPEADRMEYLLHFAHLLDIPVARDIAGSCEAALTEIGAGAFRDGGLRSVPLLIWRTENFQQWLAQTEQEVRDAEVSWADSSGAWLLTLSLRAPDGEEFEARLANLEPGRCAARLVPVR